jgi:predicted histone-like DNA-binding protein
MTLSYRLIQKHNPADLTAPKKYYASAVKRSDVSLRDLSNEIAEISTVSTVDTMAVIESLLQLIPRHVSQGDVIRLGDFGSFSVRLSSSGAETEDDFSSSLIKGLKLNFRPGKELKNQLDNVSFDKVD